MEGCRQQLKPSKSHLSAVPGLFCPKGFPRLCSLSVVICMFCSIQNHKNTQITRDSEHRRGKPFGHHGPDTAEGCEFEGFSCCRQPSTSRLQTDTQKDPRSAPRAPKRTLKNGSIDTGPQTDIQKGPQISTPVSQKDPPKTKVATQRWQLHTAQLIKQILYITY